MLPFDPTGKIGPDKPIPDQVTVLNIIPLDCGFVCGCVVVKGE